MPALAYVNGRYRPLADAAVAVEDRGLQFADSIYEVVAFLNGRFLDLDKHLWRLRRGLAALFLEGVAGDEVLAAIAARLVRESHYRDGILYLQISRGAARRGHAFPRHLRPTVIMTARSFDFRQRLVQLQQGVAAISLPDQRWARTDLKTTGLLAAVLAKEEAAGAGAFEAVLVDGNGLVTEGASSNLFLVDGAGRLVTHPLSAGILAGVTRDGLLRLARQAGIEVLERPFTLAEARAAAELWLGSTTAPLLPIVTLDGAPVADGVPGPLARLLGQLLWREVERQTGWQG